MNKIIAVFLKQIKETLNNKTVLIQLLMFPVMTVIMETAIDLEGMPEHFFVKLFAVMFIGMAPITCMSSIIAEEKEKNTLRALIMSNVSPAQYLAGVGAYVWMCCMVGAVVFALCGEYRGADMVVFLLAMAAGILLSILIGAIIGTACSSQMSATSITVPVMLVFSMLPMMAMFNAHIEAVAKLTYTYRLNGLINSIGTSSVESAHLLVMGVSYLIAIILFVVIFRKRGLE